ncbi:hypothetical protein [Fluviicola sp.]|uniref:hypothetical protein n=1 Tax=Fluviicola sp. TaxID=1917219 RepID=UPI00260EECFE|nr:hypothetical protein [Fluviicola sp.]
MKIIRFVVFLAILPTLTTSCSTENEKDAPDHLPETMTLTGTQQRDTVLLKFDFTPKTIRAKRTGKLERLIETPEFKKNDLLVQFDDYDSFVELSGEKESLKEELLGKVDNFPKSLQPIEKKWRDFANKLSPDKMLPAFPEIQYKEEAGALEEIDLVSKYNSLLKKETEIRDHFQLAPENGFIMERFAKSDDYVKKNQPLITYHPEKLNVTASAAFPLSKNIQKQIHTDFIVRIPIDTQQIVKRNAHQIKYLLKLNQPIHAKILPKHIIVNRDQHVFRVPKNYVGKDLNAKVITSKGVEKKATHFRNGEYLLYDTETSLQIQKP